MTVKALVTAAGLSSRMKDYKPMMKIGSKTIAEKVIDNLREAGAEQIIMVTGYRGDELETALADKGVAFVRNKAYASTQMFDSVKLGLTELVRSGLDFDKLLFSPIDVPMTSVDTIKRILSVDAKIVFPQYEGRVGHPISIDTGLIPGILDYCGDGGLRGALEHQGCRIYRLNVRDKGVIFDADTQDDFRMIQELENVKRTIYLVRHGTPVGYDGPARYRGQAETELCADGIAEAEALGKWFADNCFNGKIYSSPLKRAYNTAVLIAEAVEKKNDLKLKIETDSRLAEIDAGEWEGCLIEDIKREYPAEYEQRGRKMYETRIPGGESFADVGRRFIEGVKAILEANADNDADIIITTHIGTIGSFLAEHGCIEPDSIKTLVIPRGSMSVFQEKENGDISVERVGFKPVVILTDEEIERLYNKYNVPRNVRLHMKAVAAFQDELLDELEDRGVYYDRELLRKAALLHDIARLHTNHAEVGAKYLNAEGYPEIAELVANHHSFGRSITTADGDGRNASELSPKDILFYADKRVQEDRTVSLGERFSASRTKCKDEEARTAHNAIYRKAAEIEREINAILSER